jgi:hypothetical protein
LILTGRWLDFNKAGSSPQAARCIPQARLAPEVILGFDIGEEDPATAGSYRLLRDEDEILGLSFIAFRRTATMLHIPATSISGHPNQVFHVNSAEIAAALGQLRVGPES